MAETIEEMAETTIEPIPNQTADNDEFVVETIGDSFSPLSDQMIIEETEEFFSEEEVQKLL